MDSIDLSGYTIDEVASDTNEAINLNEYTIDEEPQVEQKQTTATKKPNKKPEVIETYQKQQGDITQPQLKETWIPTWLGGRKFTEEYS